MLVVTSVPGQPRQKPCYFCSASHRPRHPPPTHSCNGPPQQRAADHDKEEQSCGVARKQAVYALQAGTVGRHAEEGMCLYGGSGDRCASFQAWSGAWCSVQCRQAGRQAGRQARGGGHDQGRAYVTWQGRAPGDAQQRPSMPSRHVAEAEQSAACLRDVHQQRPQQDHQGAAHGAGQHHAAHPLGQLDAPPPVGGRLACSSSKRAADRAR